MQVRTQIEEPKLEEVAAFVTVVADVHRLVKIGDEMNQVFQCPLLLRPFGSGILQDTSEILDLADNHPAAGQNLGSYLDSAIGTLT